MFKYDSVHRKWPGTVEGTKDGIIVDGHVIRDFACRYSGGQHAACLSWGLFDPFLIWGDLARETEFCALIVTSLCPRSDPSAIPWKDAGVDYVVESTGVFTDIAKVGPARYVPL